jgi:hypothetical protein
MSPLMSVVFLLVLTHTSQAALYQIRTLGDGRFVASSRCPDDPRT